MSASDVLNAIHNTVLHSRLRAKKIADRMGMDHQVLLNKANPRNIDDRFNLEQLIALVANSENPAVGQAFLRLSGGGGEVMDILTVVLTAGVKQGDLRSVILDVMEDGVVTPAEHKRVQKTIAAVRVALDDIEATSHFLAHGDSE